jgi:hypothetical protein
VEVAVRARNPDYLRLKGRSAWLAWLWQCGHLGYRIGLLGVVLALAYALLSACLRVPSRSLGHSLFGGLVGAGVCGLVIVGSVCLRNYARKRGGWADF